MIAALQCKVVGRLAYLDNTPTACAMSGLVQAVSYSKLPMRLLYGICPDPAPRPHPRRA